METNFLNKFSGFTEIEKIALRKKVMLFFFFLVISVILWFMVALSKAYDDQINYPVSYINFPPSKVLIADVPDHLQLNVNANGFTLLRYRLSSRYLPITFSVNSFTINKLPGSDSTAFFIETRYARDHIASQLSSDFVIKRILPDTLFFKFVNVQTKKVAVFPAFKYQLGKQLILKNHLLIQPDSIIVSGPGYIIDTLSRINTLNSDIGIISKSSNETIELEEIKYVTNRTSSVNVSFEIEQFTEKTITVPVEILNTPANAKIQAFPRFVQLTCQVGLSNYEKLNNTMFRAQIDYLQVNTKENTKLTVQITKQPEFIQALRYTPEAVEYIIEK